MQIKKDTMKNALLASAENQFLLKGFDKASLRQIVKEAGTTIGNFYNYFDSKEALFESLVKRDYDSFVWFIQNHESEASFEELLKGIDRQTLKAMIKELLILKLPNFSKGLVLLFDSSHGTQYDHVKSMVLNEVKDHFLEHLNAYKVVTISPDYAQIMANQFVQGFVDILRYYDQDQQKNLLAEHILFYIYAAMAIIKS